MTPALVTANGASNAPHETITRARLTWAADRLPGLADDDFRALAEWLDRRGNTATGARWEVVSAAEMLDPLPDVPWVCREIELAPGAPTLLAGYGFTGKTVAAQALAVAVAAGSPAWGELAVCRGRVLHVDHEQGRRLTIDRYQRLIRTAGVELSADALSLAVMPPMYLDSEGAEDAYARELDGHALAIIDSLRAAAPSVSENDSEARRPLDMLSRVSERTGCAIVVLHHARKPQQGVGASKYDIRGSGALYDACQSVLVLSAEKGEPTRIEHAKARITGAPAADRVLTVSDVARGDDQRWGLSVEVSDAGVAKVAAGRAALDALCALVLVAIREQPGLSGRGVLAKLRTTGAEARTTDALAALDILESNGAVVAKTGKRRALTWWPTNVSEPARGTE